MKKLLAFLFVFAFLISFASAFNWNDGSLINHYTLNSVNSSWGGTYDNVTKTYNLKILNGTGASPALVAGKISNAINLTKTGYMVVNKSFNFNTTFTVNFWYNGQMNQTENVIFHDGATETSTSTTHWFFYTQANGAIALQGDGNPFDGVGIKVGNTTIPNQTAVMITITSTGTDFKVYVNGSLHLVTTRTGGRDYTTAWARFPSPLTTVVPQYIWYDEIGIWNRTLNASEIGELYNSGSGLAYVDPAYNVTATLQSPANATSFSATQANLTVLAETTYPNTNITNITYYVWYANGSGLANKTTVGSLSGTSVNQTKSITGLVPATYLWGASTCASNATYVNCTQLTANRTFTITSYTLLATSYSASVTEGTSSDFTINISTLAGIRVSSIQLFYNGTAYSTTTNEYATNTYYSTRTLVAPSVTVDTNYTFYWNLTFEDSTSEVTSNYNQTVFNLAIDNCSSYTNQIYNFTLVDEDTQVPINVSIANTTTSIEVDMQFKNPATEAIVINYSALYNNTNNARICSNANLGSSLYRVDATVRYENTGRFTEFYNIRNYSMNATTASQNITLFDLNSSIGQEYKITYKDENFQITPGYLIQIQRKYLSEGIFKTVEIPQISSEGYAIAHLVSGNQLYNLVVVSGGEVVATFNNIIASCQNPSFTECTININSLGSSVSPKVFVDGEDFTSTLAYNKTSRVLTAVFSVPSGAVATVNLNATLSDNLGNQSVCSDSLVSAGGTLTCTVPSNFGNATMFVAIYKDGVLQNNAIVILSQTPQQVYGTNLVFIALMMILFILGIGVSDSPALHGILLIVGGIILVGMNIFYSTSWIGVGATILWFIVAIVLILIKGARR